MTADEARREARVMRADGGRLVAKLTEFVKAAMGDTDASKADISIVFIIRELEKLNARLLDIEDEIGIDSSPESVR